jgi:hypothetical protein
MRENDGGMNLSKVHCEHIWKCHSDPASPPPVQLRYANKMLKVIPGQNFVLYRSAALCTCIDFILPRSLGHGLSLILSLIH